MGAAGAFHLADPAGAVCRGPGGLPLGAGPVARRRRRRPCAGARKMTHDILTLTDVRKSFGEAQIIRGVNLAIEAGERHAVIGPNGAGKSTLFHLMSGSFAPTSGDISLRSHHERIPAPVGSRKPAPGRAAHARAGLQLLAPHRAQPRRQ
ncbi:hypothetical protein G6F68_016680 [Rhizopus microsporus]|nr:hypothetical protein G6F31_017560 [Rhizopus arrhizus]KAG1241492.1 hypothetical protein G6F68_016680 [Rhizopus microsporus]